MLDEVAEETGLSVYDTLGSLFSERELLLVRGFFAEEGGVVLCNLHVSMTILQLSDMGRSEEGRERFGKMRGLT